MVFTTVSKEIVRKNYQEFIHSMYDLTCNRSVVQKWQIIFFSPDLECYRDLGFWSAPVVSNTLTKILNKLIVEDDYFLGYCAV